jgi:hypothetical protein
MRYIILLVCCFPWVAIYANPDQHNEAAFERLKSLVGEWKKVGSDGTSFYISFKTSANDSVLIENWMRQDSSHSLTLYHMDNGKILATHYCPLGNQPRLQLESSLNDKSFAFVFKDATNLLSHDKSHQQRLSINIISANEIELSEIYVENGKPESSSMRLVRK